MVSFGCVSGEYFGELSVFWGVVGVYSSVAARMAILAPWFCYFSGKYNGALAVVSRLIRPASLASPLPDVIDRELKVRRRPFFILM